MPAGGSNFSIPLPGAKAGDAAASFEDELSRTIVDAENSSAWTLMHRYNKAADVLAQTLSVSTPFACPNFAKEVWQSDPVDFNKTSCSTGSVAAEARSGL